MLDLAVAIPTLVGSVLSMFASGFIFICYLVLPPRRHFRHTLILNLAAADFFNSTNNTISGIYALSHGSIPAGAACSLNGWIGQVTVQGTDFAILFISVATVITLRKWNYQPEMTRSKKFFTSFGIWLVPLITSFTGLALNDYKPVSGNWCWLDSEKPGLRYALGHGWRIAIISIVIILFSYLFIYMHRHFAAQRHIARLNEGLDTVRIEHWSDSMSIVDEEIQEIRKNIYVHDEFEVSEEDGGRYVRKQPEGKPWYEDNEYFANLETHPKDIAKAKIKDKEPTPPFSPYFNITQTFHPHGSQLTRNTISRRVKETSPLLTRDPLALIRRPPPTLVTTTISPTYYPPTAVTSRECHIQKLLILNAYPIGYVVLWIPGLANRFAELTGHQSRFLSIAQASTQFVGLANALVYGYNERIWSLARLWLAEKLERKQTAEFNDLEKVEISWPLGPPTPIYEK